MAKKKLFCSYDYKEDKKLKGSLIVQAKDPLSPFSVNDFSLKESIPDKEWVSKAQSAISRCEFFCVILGKNTHQAPGVLREVKIARGYRRTCFQIRPQGKKHQKNKPVKDAGEVIVWKWKNISLYMNQHVVR
jgi:hypothetical protein